MTPSEYHQLRQYERSRQSRSALFTVFIVIPIVAAAIVAAVVTLTWVAEGMR